MCNEQKSIIFVKISIVFARKLLKLSSCLQMKIHNFFKITNAKRPDLGISHWERLVSAKRKKSHHNTPNKFLVLELLHAASPFKFSAKKVHHSRFSFAVFIRLLFSKFKRKPLQTPVHIKFQMWDAAAVSLLCAVFAYAQTLHIQSNIANREEFPWNVMQKWRAMEKRK